MITSLALSKPVISSLEAGIRACSSRWIESESELRAVIVDSRELASVQASPDDWATGCRHHWSHVTAIVRRIDRLVTRLHEAIISGHPQAALLTWATWEVIQRQESKLALALGALRTHADEINEAAARDWYTLAQTIETHRKTLQPGIQELRGRLETWARLCPPESPAADERTPATARPGAEGMDPATYTQDFDRAAVEIEAEQHQETGLIDGVKSLFMWVDTPGERVRRNERAAGDAT